VATDRRPKVSAAVEVRILTLSRRRCSLCYGLYGNVDPHQGQIAHVDRDRTNNVEDNLAFLCLPHHDDYDSRRSQSKRYTSDELRKYRADLYERMAELPSLPTWADADAERSPRSRRKLSAPSLELYDRRIRIYRAGKELISAVIAKAAIDFPAVWKFADETDEALFLFDRGVSEHLAELFKQALKLATTGEVLKNTPIGPEREKRVDRQMNIVLWFNDQLGPLREKIAPYLTLG
jgi:hypothetical protein